MPKKRRGPKWIWKLKAGTLTAYLKARFGRKAFTGRGTIKVNYLRDLANQAGRVGKGVTERTRKRAQAALNLRKLRKKK